MHFPFIVLWLYYLFYVDIKVGNKNNIWFATSIDELILDETKNIAGVLKFLVIKVSVGAIVVQGLVAQFLSVTATSPYVDDDHFTADEKTTRGYCT